jgi:hypothetical protein
MEEEGEGGTEARGEDGQEECVIVICYLLER